MKRLHVALVLLISLCLISCIRDSAKYVEYGNNFLKKGKRKEASLMYRKAIQKNRKNSEAYYREGLNQLESGNLSAAISYLRRSVDIDQTDNHPTNIDAVTKLEDIYLLAYFTDPRSRSKELLDEIKELNLKLIKKDPKSFDSLRFSGFILLAESSRENNTVSRAIEKFRAANEVKPYQPDLVRALAQALIANGQFDEAEKLAKAAIAKNPAYGPMYDLLYAEYLPRNRINDAEAILKSKSDNNPKNPDALLRLAGHYAAQKRRSDMENVLNRVANNPKDFPQGHLMVGKFYALIKEYDTAIQQYQAGIREVPKDKALYQKQIAIMLASLGRLPEASQLAKEVLKENPKDPEATQLNASLVLQTGTKEQVQTAVNDLQALVTSMPQNGPLRFDLARAQLAKGDLESALTQLQEAIRLRPDLVGARLLLGEIQIGKGEHAKALQTAQDILEKIDPRNTTARLIRSSALMGIGDLERSNETSRQAYYDKSRVELLSLLQADPKLSDARYQLGLLSFKEKKFKEAEDAFRKLWESTPPDPRGLTGLVETAVIQNNFQKAIDMLEAELVRNPKRFDYRLQLANIEVRGQKYDEAIQNYNLLLKAYPNDYLTYLRLGETQRLKGDINAAIEGYKKSSALNPTDPLPTLQLAILLDSQGRRAESKTLYEQVLKNQPDNPVALNNAAFIKAEEGVDLDQALTMAQKAKQRLPQDPNVADTLGWIYIKKNLSDDAIQLFRQLVKDAPKNSTYRFHLAMALYQKGDKPSARKECELALRDSASKEEQGKIKEWMAKIG